ncbi:MAG: DNA-binding transcriptional LysR family regulator [Cellvibrionaceae bacterium]|jgi:DNA-binding transcriptional LysR family regulator
MEFRQLEAFIAVVREGSFTHAAERLNLSQPSLSSRIQQLEIDMGVTLFKRDKRPIELTDTGKTFLPYAERIMGIAEAGERAIKVAEEGFSGRLTVGCPTSVSTYLMPQVVTLFNRQFPQSDLSVENGHSALLVERLLDGVLDIVFTAVFPHLIRQTQILMRIRDRIVVAAHPDHPLLMNGNHLALDDLWQWRIIMPRWGTPFEAWIDSYRELAESPRPLVKVPLSIGLPMMSQPNSLTFVPERVAQAAGLKTLQVPDLNWPWDVVLVTRPGLTLPPLGQEFLKAVSEFT